MIKKLFINKIQILWFALSVLCLVYSGMVFMVGSGTFSFAIWIVGAVFFAICYYLAGNGRWMRIPKIVRMILYVLIGIAASVFIVCEVAILSHFFDKGEKDLDYIIVLGAQMKENGPSVIYRYRLEKAFEYLEDNEHTVCIVTGGQGYNEPVTEGDGGAEYLMKLGISEDRIIIENTSVDTVENIENAVNMIRDREEDESSLKIGIITNGFHVFRGVHLAMNITEAKVCGLAAYMQLKYIPNNMVRECFGILKDLVTGDLKF